MDELAQTIELRRSQGLDAALAVVRTDRGKAAMDQIRAICNEIQTTSYDLLTQQREDVARQRLSSGTDQHAGERSRFRAPRSGDDHHPEGNAPASTADRRSSEKRGESQRSARLAANDDLQHWRWRHYHRHRREGRLFESSRPILDRLDAGAGGRESPWKRFSTSATKKPARLPTTLWQEPCVREVSAAFPITPG